MLPTLACLGIKRAVSTNSSGRKLGSEPLKRGIGVKVTPNSNSLFRFMCTYTAPSSTRKKYYKKDKSQRIPPDVAKQIAEDSKWKVKERPKTGPNTGSIRSRRTESKSPRYPESFTEQLQEVEAGKGPHLDAIKKHFLEELDLKFDDWEMVQSALTHYSYSAARRTNDSLSRLGEKALRFILTTEMVKLDPVSSKQSWFLTVNLRFLTRFEFLSSYIDSTLQIGPLTRYNEPGESKVMYKHVAGKEAVQYRQSVVAKSILALIGVIYNTKGEIEAREFVRTLFIDPYKDENGRFQAPVLQPMQIRQTGRL